MQIAMNEFAHLVTRAEQLIDRLEQLLPPVAVEPDWSAATAFLWRKRNGRAQLYPVRRPHLISLGDLQDVSDQKARIDQNTRQFLEGRRANNVLLTGARGTGKSSLVKAVLNAYSDRGLRLIEVDKDDLMDLTDIVELVAGRHERFILFCDDLSFEDSEPSARRRGY
jgi:predicted AAA+ superfamily ATPase